MATVRPRSRWAIAGAILVLAGAVLAGAVVAGQLRQTDPGAFRADLATGDVERVASIAASDGHPARGVFVQRTEMGRLCLWDAPSASSPERGGGCNSADDPLGASVLSASLAYEGGPGAKGVRDARLIGLTDGSVAAVEIVMTDGTRRRVSLEAATVGPHDLGAFGYRFEQADLRKGIGPTAVVALDSTGAEVGRQPTGFGG
jgi:hypothetical protein